MMTISAPAKINLFLGITAKRSDGYHEIHSLMCPVGLADTLVLDPLASRTAVTCNDPAVPTDASNSAFQAAEFFRKALARRCKSVFSGVNITIEKRIPMGAGLGGGSSDAAAVLAALNRHAGHPFSHAELVRLGLRIGADVPFFLAGGPAVVTGIGERLQPFRGLSPLAVLLLYPGVSVSTAEVYKNLDLGLTNCEKTLKDWPLKYQAFDASRHLCNDLETVTLKQYPQVAAAKKALAALGGLGVLMSGSGSTVFGLYAAARDAEQAMQGLPKNRAWKAFLTELRVGSGRGVSS